MSSTAKVSLPVTLLLSRTPPLPLSVRECMTSTAIPPSAREWMLRQWMVRLGQGRGGVRRSKTSPRQKAGAVKDVWCGEDVETGTAVWCGNVRWLPSLCRSGKRLLLDPHPRRRNTMCVGRGSSLSLLDGGYIVHKQLSQQPLHTKPLAVLTTTPHNRNDLQLYTTLQPQRL